MTQQHKNHDIYPDLVTNMFYLKSPLRSFIGAVPHILTLYNFMLVWNRSLRKWWIFSLFPSSPARMKLISRLCSSLPEIGRQPFFSKLRLVIQNKNQRRKCELMSTLRDDHDKIIERYFFPPCNFPRGNSSTQSFSAFSLPEEWLKYGEWTNYYDKLFFCSLAFPKIASVNKDWLARERQERLSDVCIYLAAHLIERMTESNKRR